ncbi:hypothetical protein IDJ77_06415 [Mucilaginibacter sp. ZT4R22]|uniref:Uncharacterized protein n=1 Tax=Mucilaginibacter pankratovii TaxID=2772110 RepID=A0ABR7WQ99_9SPHI|nr:hypothetical protein [Mucilaginibacter pankratovii]MBD1363437.1 hypothetical protein [Mucilaginibacter pankratovii]
MWKFYLIIISNTLNIKTTQVAERLGLDTSIFKTVNFMSAQKIGSVSIGLINENITIVSDELALEFLETDAKQAELDLVKLFPGSKITVLVANPTVNLYGFSLIENGKRIRVKSGADDDVYIDFGKPVSYELQLSAEKIFSDEELQEITEENGKDGLQRILDNERGVRTTLHLEEMLLGKGEMVSNITLTNYPNKK